MCYRVSQKVKGTELVKHYKAPLFEELPGQPVYYHANGFSHPDLWTLANNKDGDKQTISMKWGLMPNWKKPLSEMLALSNNTLNAKGETIFEKPSFKGSIMTKRCILPVDGFYEYKEVGKDKLPYFIHPKEQPYFNLACIYANYQNPETNQWIRSFSIITGPANELMADIHNTKFRQPIILSDSQIDSWLDPNISKEEVIHLMEPCDDTAMAAYRVDRNLIKIGNNPEAMTQFNDSLF
ncbi:SOS response-associated peptidase [Pedobacter sp. AW1-32]|uniref:SOS response-associated peptidase n=1 Tax=Pedobacter sp. AW1-32 TaxID=3383026 RepID=UPI003FEE3ED8